MTDLGDSLMEPCRDMDSPGLTVLIDGDGGVTLSEEITGGAGADARPNAKYER